MRFAATLIALSSFAAIAACSSGPSQYARLDGPSGVPAQSATADFVDPVTNLPRWESQTGDTFFLTSDKAADTITYSSPRDVSICIENGGTRADDAPVGVVLSWDGGKTTTVNPGSCMRVTAQDMTVAAASPLPAGAALRGRVTTS